MLSIEIALVLLKLTHRIKRNAWHQLYCIFPFCWQIDDGKIDMCPMQKPKTDDTHFCSALFRIGKPEIGNWILSFRLHSFHWEISTEIYVEKCLFTWKLNAIDIQFVLLFIYLFHHQVIHNLKSLQKTSPTVAVMADIDVIRITCNSTSNSDSIQKEYIRFVSMKCIWCIRFRKWIN